MIKKYFCKKFTYSFINGVWDGVGVQQETEEHATCLGTTVPQVTLEFKHPQTEMPHSDNAWLASWRMKNYVAMKCVDLWLGCKWGLIIHNDANARQFRKARVIYLTSNIMYVNDQGAISIQKCRFTSIGISMLKIRWTCDHLIFNMGIPIPRKYDLYTETGLWYHKKPGHQQTWYQPSANNIIPLSAWEGLIQL